MQKNVYVWEFPIRLTHWLNVLSIVMLSVTGIYIGAPFIHALYTTQYIMGTVRFLHFAFAYLFIVSLAFRIYWMFKGNRFSVWSAYNPLAKGKVKLAAEHCKFYMCIANKPPKDWLGHTASASLAYIGLLVLFLFMIASGSALYYNAQPNLAVFLMGGWLGKVFSISTLRLWHHLVMWFILTFVIVHVYLGWLLDRFEKNGIMSSIFSGYKVGE
ncbi:MAG: Ni/Fe-hydrogenase, b-type cytochrome subunit [Dissulfurispiraceae bacterium]|nr:Ni/Fe-hydrogenase, b-type cytochrome subunit [Dissulfurispiraceae bacterium]